MYSPPQSEDDAERMAAEHTSAAAALGATVTGRPVWGWYGRTLGHHVHHPAHGACWLRLLSASSGDEGGKLWEGNELAARLFTGVHRPPLYAVRDWVRDGFAYRAELSGFVADPVLSPSPVVSDELDLTDAWLKSIRGDLDTIAGTATDRVAVRQQWIDRAVPAYTGRPAPQITEWECAHGDFHAANITRSGIILDWEGFGLAPRGWDVAVFLAYTQLAPRTADRVRVEFADLFDSDMAGRVALLVACADLLQSASRGDHPELVPALRSLVDWCAPA